MTAFLAAAMPLLKRYWPFALAAAIVLAFGLQTARLHHAKADLAACRAARAADEAVIKRMEDQSKATTAAAQKAADAAAKDEGAAKIKVADIMKPRPGDPADCLAAKAIIQEALN